jgi:hypothetical protein
MELVQAETLGFGRVFRLTNQDPEFDRLPE